MEEKQPEDFNGEQEEKEGGSLNLARPTPPGSHSAWHVVGIQ